MTIHSYQYRHRLTLHVTYVLSSLLLLLLLCCCCCATGRAAGALVPNGCSVKPPYGSCVPKDRKLQAR
eukprot:20797-Heterococcus_DN1.PRE.1